MKSARIGSEVPTDRPTDRPKDSPAHTDFFLPITKLYFIGEILYIYILLNRLLNALLSRSRKGNQRYI